jgi:hypothetical protein
MANALASAQARQLIKDQKRRRKELKRRTSSSSGSRGGVVWSPLPALPPILPPLMDVNTDSSSVPLLSANSMPPSTHPNSNPPSSISLPYLPPSTSVLSSFSPSTSFGEASASITSTHSDSPSSSVVGTQTTLTLTLTQTQTQTHTHPLREQRVVLATGLPAALASFMRFLSVVSLVTILGLVIQIQALVRLETRFLMSCPWLCPVCVEDE